MSQYLSISILTDGFAFFEKSNDGFGANVDPNSQFSVMQWYFVDLVGVLRPSNVAANLLINTARECSMGLVSRQNLLPKITYGVNLSSDYLAVFQVMWAVC